MEDENVLDFNFWPSFADLMLSLVFILVLVLFLVTAIMAVGTVNLSHVKKNQMNIINSIASAYGVELKKLTKDSFGISTGGTSIPDLIIRNEPILQKITFSEHILFPSIDYKLSFEGRKVLRLIGSILKPKLSLIKDIQIQGHADTDIPLNRILALIPINQDSSGLDLKAFGQPLSNLDLAALRAIEVFKFLQDSVGIDPAENLMSATSYGEFKPVQRSEDDLSYNREKLLNDNRSGELKDRNRRIELLLFFRF